jgi:hypothetical protein
LARFAKVKPKRPGSKFAKHFAQGELLVPHLNNWFAAGEFPDEIPLVIRPNKERDDAFHPSSALMCERALYAKLSGDLPPEQTRLDQEKTFMIGRYYHELIQWIVVDQLGLATWEDVEKEHDLHFVTGRGHPYRVRGFIDVARMELPGSDEPVLLDIKTMASRLYGMAQPPAGLMEKYEAQVRIYLEFEDLPRAIILVVEKDNPHRMREIVVERNGSMVDAVMEGWENVVNSRAEGTIPDCTCEDPGRCPAKDIYDVAHQTRIPKD